MLDTPLTARAKQIADRALPKGWRVREEQANIGLLILERPGEQVNVYYTRMTVGTCVFHPGQKKRTQLFRRNVTPHELDRILSNPRAHTGKGYHQA